MLCHGERCLLAQQWLWERRRPQGRGSEGSLPFRADDREQRRQLPTPSQSGLDERRRRCWCGDGVDATVVAVWGSGEGTLLAARAVLLVKY